MNSLNFLTMQDLDRLAAKSGNDCLKELALREITDRENEFKQMHNETYQRLFCKPRRKYPNSPL